MAKKDFAHGVILKILKGLMILHYSHGSLCHHKGPHQRVADDEAVM